MNNSHFLALWRGIEEPDPLDAAPRLILADWLADHDHDPDLERGLRWAVEHEWWPVAIRWDGVNAGEKYIAPRVSDAKGLSNLQLNRMVDMVCSVGARLGNRFCGCSTQSVQDAVRNVGMALEELDKERESQ